VIGYRISRPHASAPADYIDVTRAAYEGGAVLYRGRTSSFDSFPGLRQEVEDFADATAGGRILEVGVGSGRDLELLAQRSVVFPFDLARHFLELLSRPLRVQGNMLELPYRDGCFDAVWCSATLLHLTRVDARVALQEVRRVLIPHGLAAISVRVGVGQGWRQTQEMGPRWFTFFQPTTLVALCTSSDLKVEHQWVRHVGERAWLTVLARRRNQ